MHSLIKRLKSDYPQFDFKKSDEFIWSHCDQTIYYTDDDHDTNLLFHEVSHGLLNHTDYTRDIELISMERQAWDKARELASQYDIVIDDDFIESNLNTYREWLHARSTCPNCKATGVQSKKDTYKCIACGTSWHVNDAKNCNLRRTKQKT